MLSHVDAKKGLDRGWGHFLVVYSTILLYVVSVQTCAAEPIVLFPSKGYGVLNCTGDCDSMSDVYCIGIEEGSHHFEWFCGGFLIFGTHV